MNFLLPLILLIILSCSIDDRLSGIEWKELSGKSYGIIETQNTYQVVHICMRFGFGDTIYMTKKYWNPTDQIFNCEERSSWTRYFKCPVYGKHWEIPLPVSDLPNKNDTNLVFQYRPKEYADSLYKQPILDNTPLVDWFVWKEQIDGLYMGYINSNRETFYWIWHREK